jgi:small subunit ribosomal protein S6
MNFDASPRTLQGLNSLLRKDPRVIRWTMLKEGEKVEDVVRMKEQTVETPMGTARDPTEPRRFGQY